MRVQIELSSESNLFFHYIHQMSPSNFKELQVCGCHPPPPSPKSLHA